MSSRKIKSVSDPELAHSHKKGSTVLLVQTAVHPSYGTILFSVLDHTDFYLKAAEHHLDEAKKLHNKIFTMPVDKSNCRLVTDNELIGNFFLHSQSVVLFSYLSLEYFAIDCARGFGKTEEWKRKRIDQKIKHMISQELNIPRLPQDLCNAFGEIENRRHSLNHPQMNNIVNGSETEWDTVHLSWLMLGNYEKAYQNSNKIIKYFSEPFRSEMKKKPSDDIILTDVKRGLRFTNSAKKQAKE